MYAISFDLSVSSLENFYPNRSYNNAYAEIRNFLISAGFSHQQGSLYFGNSEMNAVKTVLTISNMSKALPWLKDSVSDIRMLRIEENNDLFEAL